MPPSAQQVRAEHVVVGAFDISRSAWLSAHVAPGRHFARLGAFPLRIEGGDLLVGQILPIGILVRALERRAVLAAPDAGQVRRAPRRAGRRPPVLAPCPCRAILCKSRTYGPTPEQRSRRRVASRLSALASWLLPFRRFPRSAHGTAQASSWDGHLRGRHVDAPKVAA